MFDKPHVLEVSRDELEVIEAALHTQTQILTVQATAGGEAALERLNKVKRTLATLVQQKPVERKPCAKASWLMGFFKSRIAG